MNDSLRTDVFMRFRPERIAVACIFLAARHLKVFLVHVLEIFRANFSAPCLINSSLM